MPRPAILIKNGTLTEKNFESCRARYAWVKSDLDKKSDNTYAVIQAALKGNLALLKLLYHAGASFKNRAGDYIKDSENMPLDHIAHTKSEEMHQFVTHPPRRQSVGYCLASVALRAHHAHQARRSPAGDGGAGATSGKRLYFAALSAGGKVRPGKSQKPSKSHRRVRTLDSTSSVFTKLKPNVGELGSGSRANPSNHLVLPKLV